MAHLDVSIEKIVAGGDGLARHADRVVFVPESAPGERHRVEIVEEKKDYLRAKSVACLEASETRRVAPCMYYGRCGGCSLMHLGTDAQLAAKRDVLLESLRRGGAPAGDVPLELSPSPESAYRTRLRFHVSPRQDRLEMGFRERRSHRVEDIENCHHAGSGIGERWRRIKRFFEADPTVARGVESIELQESSHEAGRVMALFFVRSRDELRRFDPDVRRALVETAWLEGLAVVSEGREVREGRPHVHHRVEDVLLRQSAGAFFQANRFLVETLVQLVAPSEPVARLVDFYCGVGLFSIPRARSAGDSVGVDASPWFRSVLLDRGRFAKDFRFRRDDFVVVDPPRGGLPRALRQALATSPVRDIRYVSCDPAALARDAASFRASGFRIERLHLLDCFSETPRFRRATLFIGPWRRLT